MGYHQICDCDSCGKPIPSPRNNAHYLDVTLGCKTPDQQIHMGRSHFDTNTVVCPDCFEFWKKATMQLIDTLNALKSGKMKAPPQLSAAPVKQLPEEQTQVSFAAVFGALGDGS